MPELPPLPQLESAPFLTDGGLETTLIFHDRLDLVDFAAFPLLHSVDGLRVLERYFSAYIDIATRHGVGIVLETPTWRANPDWGRRLGYTSAQLRAANMSAVAQLLALRAAHTDERTPIVISGNIGPRGDGYSSASALSPNESQRYHSEQIRALRDAGADLVTALTITHVDEAIGIVKAAVEHDIPVVISFTVEVDGTLPSGQSLAQAIIDLDEATDAAAAYMMVNCAHPTHILNGLSSPSEVFDRVRGVRANASRLSHAELDNSDELDAGDPAELAALYRDLRTLLPHLTIMGGCCGTDERHIEAIATACMPLFAAS